MSAVLASPPPRRLAVGCGRSPISGWINIDAAPLPGVDLVCDLEAVRELRAVKPARPAKRELIVAPRIEISRVDA